MSVVMFYAVTCLKFAQVFLLSFATLDPHYARRQAKTEHRTGDQAKDEATSAGRIESCHESITSSATTTILHKDACHLLWSTNLCDCPWSQCTFDISNETSQAGRPRCATFNLWCPSVWCWKKKLSLSLKHKPDDKRVRWVEKKKGSLSLDHPSPTKMSTWIMVNREGKLIYTTANNSLWKKEENNYGMVMMMKICKPVSMNVPIKCPVEK